MLTLRFLRAGCTPAATASSSALLYRSTGHTVLRAALPLAFPPAQRLAHTPQPHREGCPLHASAFGSQQAQPQAQPQPQTVAPVAPSVPAQPAAAKHAKSHTAEEVRPRVEELTQIIREANAGYYGPTASSALSDAQYDALWSELVALERAHPSLLRPDSPTQKPGAAPLADLAETGVSAMPVPHRLPMLSLDSTTSTDKLRKWDASLQKRLAVIHAAKDKSADAESDADVAADDAAPSSSSPSTIPYTLELKYDGIAVSLIYENLRLVRVLTRGTGEVGEDITRAVARWVRNVPQQLSAAALAPAHLSRYARGVVEVRGEVLLSKHRQKEYVAFQLAHGGPKQVDVARTPPRNLAGGLLRRDIGGAAAGVEEALDPSGASCPPCLSLVAYSLHFHHPQVRHVLPYLKNPKGEIDGTVHEPQSVPATQGEALRVLEAMGMPVSVENAAGAPASPPAVVSCLGIDAVITELDSLASRRDELPFGIDGAVVKMDVLADCHALGATNRHPKGILAFKFAAKSAVTTLEGVQWQVGRTGKLVPIALLRPVVLDGVNVKRANLHNAQVLQEMQLRVGDLVEVERRGDVIPYVVGKAQEAEVEAAETAAVSAVPSPALDASLPNRGDLITLPDHCPCGQRSTLELRPSASDPSRSDLFCTSPTCTAALAGSLEHYCSKGVMDISGVGGATLALLMQHGFLSSVADLVRLPSRREELKRASAHIDGFTHRKADTVCDKIEEAHAAASDERLLLALGIPKLGRAQAAALVGGFGSVDAVLDADLPTLREAQIRGLGPKLLESFADAFAQAREGEVVRAWREQGIVGKGSRSPAPKRAPSTTAATATPTKKEKVAKEPKEPRAPKEPKSPNTPKTPVSDEEKAASRAASAAKAKEKRAQAVAERKAARAEAQNAKLAERAAAQAERAAAKAARAEENLAKEEARAARLAAKQAKAEQAARAAAADAAAAANTYLPFSGLNLCVLGSLHSAKRTDVLAAIKALGGKVSFVPKAGHTTHLVLGGLPKNATEHAQPEARAAALQAGARQMDEQQFADMMQAAAGGKDSFEAYVASQKQEGGNGSSSSATRATEVVDAEFTVKGEPEVQQEKPSASTPTSDAQA